MPCETQMSMEIEVRVFGQGKRYVNWNEGGIHGGESTTVLCKLQWRDKFLGTGRKNCHRETLKNAGEEDVFPTENGKNESRG